MRPSVVLALLQVEGVVLVGLVGGAADETVKYRRVVLDAGTVGGGVSVREREEAFANIAQPHKTQVLVIGLMNR